MGRIMAIDYGLKRTGIAVTDPLKIIASPLTTVPTAELLDYVKQYCSTEPVEAFVVGLPLHHDGNPTHISAQVDQFAAKLAEVFQRPVHRQDERFTSVEAKRIILNSGIKKQKRRDKALVDKIAAAVILDQFMMEKFW
jgi:putative Holliday junction resolvase